MMNIVFEAMLGVVLAVPAGSNVAIVPGQPVSLPLGPPQSIDAALTLRAGESADLAVLQDGVDVAVDAFAPNGALLDSVDSPNGRQGDEPVSLFAARGGRYRLHIRPISASEPAGRITIRVVSLRDVIQTRQLLAERRAARLEAAAWLRRQDVPLPADPATAASLAPFDGLAENARVIGLGEATHGSREFNDFRLALVQRLVRRHGYRLIAIEDSASRWRVLEPYIEGEADSPAGPLEWGWIGVRSRRALLDWVRQWNLEHRTDRVRIVGIDAQDNAASRDGLGAFLERAYGAVLMSQWRTQLPELQAADEQTAVFGDSGTSPALRQFAIELAGQLERDGPLLRRRFGEREYEGALATARDLAAFTDFNNGSGAISHSRDWYMALGLMRAVDQMPGHPKAVFWGHNAHVSALPTRWGPTGALLRQALGCSYRAIATTFGQGAFVAQVPNDPEDRLHVNAVPAAADETVEGVLALVRPGAHITAWECPASPGEGIPAWLRSARPLRWVGGLYAPDTAPSGSYQPYRLTEAFDAIAYFPRVSADTVPTDRPRIPARVRPPGAAP